MHPYLQGALGMGVVVLVGAAWRTWEYIDARRADWKPVQPVLTERQARQAIEAGNASLDTIDDAENVRAQLCYSAARKWASRTRHRGSPDRRARIEALIAEADLGWEISQPRL